MYIALVTPIILNELYNKKLILLNIILLFLSIIALYLLNCRTAWVAMFIPFIIFIIKPLFLILKLKILKRGIVGLCLIFFLFCFNFLYQYKQNSADGRMLIWKLSAKEIIHHPQGNGYGRFASVYNQIQSDYFKDFQGNAIERQNARFTTMAYNDYLESGVDGGLGGLLLQIILISTFVLLSYKQQNKITISIFLMVAIMSSMNFFITSILPWMVFLITAGYTLSVQPHDIKSHPIIQRALYLFICILALFLSYRQIQFVYGQYLLAKSPKVDKSEILSISDFIGTSEAYYRTIALYYIQNKNWSKAVEQCDKALLYVLYPSVLQMKAYALLQDKKINDSEASLQTIRYMIPTHMGCRYKLLKLYQDHNIQRKAHDMAHEILSIKPVTNTKETKYIQNEAKHYLNNIHHEHTKHFYKTPH